MKHTQTPDSLALTIFPWAVAGLALAEAFAITGATLLRARGIR